MTKHKLSGIWLIVIDDEASPTSGRREIVYQTYLKKNVNDSQFNSDLNYAYAEAAIRIVETDIKGFKTSSEDDDFAHSLSNGALFDDMKSIMKAKGYSEVELHEEIRDYTSNSTDVSHAVKQAEERAGRTRRPKSSIRTKRKKR